MPRFGSETGWVGIAAKAKEVCPEDEWRRLMDFARAVAPDRASLDDASALAIALERTERFMQLAGPMLAPVADMERRKRHDEGEARRRH